MTQSVIGYSSARYNSKCPYNMPNEGVGIQDIWLPKCHTEDL